MRCEKQTIQVDYARVNAIQAGDMPVLTSYQLDASLEIPASHMRPAVIICPGGGYHFTSDREAEPVAMRFLATGIHAFVLRYSVQPSRYPTAVLELAAAVKLVRENASAYGVIPEQIYIAGFSAGGHLCATLGTLWDEPLFKQAFGSNDAAAWRPNGMILSYPVITMGAFTHQGSRDNLLGKDAAPAKINELSLETRVTDKTVPTYLWHTVEDGAVPVENTLQFATALRKANVSFEMHLFESGGHGLSLCDYTTMHGPEQLVPDDASWMEMAIRWILRKA